jgi:RNA polymerase-binding transcription factor
MAQGTLCNPLAVSHATELAVRHLMMVDPCFARAVPTALPAIGCRQTMTKHENIAKALKARLSELTNRVVEIDSELRKPLSADLEEQATDLENQGALEAIENSEILEIHQIQEALKRISEGTYGICARCGEDIDPKRLKALPTATRCISCAV